MMDNLRDGEALAAVKGLTIASIVGLVAGSDHVEILFSNGEKLDFQHQQDCCEMVTLEDIEGTDGADYEGAVVSNAYEASNEAKAQPYPAGEGRYEDSYTWTFYRIVTDKGTIVMRWLGESNGYYSESVDVELIPSPRGTYRQVDSL